MVKKVILLLLAFLLVNCGKKEVERAEYWNLEGTVYCDNVPTGDMQVMWGTSQHSQFHQTTWTDHYVTTDEEGKYSARHRPNETSLNVLNYRVSALNPYTSAWTDPQNRRNIIMAGRTDVEDFYFFSEQ